MAYSSQLILCCIKGVFMPLYVSDLLCHGLLCKAAAALAEEALTSWLQA